MRTSGFWICALGLMSASDVFAAGFANTNQSATATAMAGVGVANTEEPNSSYYNPAAMTLSEFSASVGDVMIIPSTSFRGDDGSETSTEFNLIPPPNLHLGYSVIPGLAVGVGATFPYGLTIEWPQDWSGREIVRKQALQTMNINPNIAYEIPGSGVSVSAGAQVVFGSVELTRAIVLRPDGREVDAQLGGDALGFGAGASLLWRPSDEWSFGLNYKSSVTLDFEGKAHFEGEEDTPFESTFVDQAISTSVTLPQTLSAGVGYRDESLFIGLDVSLTYWNSYDQVELKFSEPCEAGDPACEVGVDASNPPTTVIEGDWMDSPTFRLGLEYMVRDDLALRVGAAYDMSPIPDATVSPSLPGNHRGIVSAGLGYQLDPLRLDLGYQYVATTREIRNGNNDGFYRTTAHILGLGASYSF